ncbi:histidine phosphatase family protein [Pseudomonas phoenicis]|uniref:histidine phosphatase family protein n=1 Tax=unclassified Pseudomonas TaxID=196821 RepID=UPI0039A0E645
MQAIELTLLCHAATEAQRTGHFARQDDALRDMPAPRSWPPALQCLVAPERRTVQTAAALGLAGQVDTALADMDMGCWGGRSLKDVQLTAPEALRDWLDDPLAAPHGGESLRQVSARVGAWLDRGLPPGQWLAVTHPWVMRAALQHVLGGALAKAGCIDVLPLAELRMNWHGYWRLRVD